MSKGSFIAIVALMVAIAGAIVAFAAYFHRRGCSVCDGLEDFEDDEEDLDDLDYYATQLDQEEIDEEAPVDHCCSSGCDCGCNCKDTSEKAEEADSESEK